MKKGKSRPGRRIRSVARRPLFEAEGDTTDAAIEILSTIVNDLQNLGDEAAAGLMAPEEDGGLSVAAQTTLGNDVQAANDILTQLLAKLEGGDL